MAYLAPFTEPLRTETFRFNRRWLQSQAERVGDLRSPSFDIGRRLNLPPQYLLVHRVTMGTLGVLCQLDAGFRCATSSGGGTPRRSSTSSAPSSDVDRVIGGSRRSSGKAEEGPRTGRTRAFRQRSRRAAGPPRDRADVAGRGNSSRWRRAGAERGAAPGGAVRPVRGEVSEGLRPVLGKRRRAGITVRRPGLGGAWQPRSWPPPSVARRSCPWSRPRSRSRVRARS